MLTTAVHNLMRPFADGLVRPAGRVGGPPFG